jgi:fructose-1,6-bisphosphatase/inositol monophosphatase family enzyme
MFDPETVSNHIRAAARAFILPRFRALDASDIREKKPGDLVTVADTDTEHALTHVLREILPGANVVGEEAVHEDPKRLNGLAGDAPVWIIDPVDGTANFARGNPGFAVIVALAQGDIVEAGWIYHPIGDTMVSAVRGQGTWVDGQRVRFDRPIPPERLTGSAYGRTRSGQRAARALNNSGRVLGVHNQGCSGLEYILLAQGISQFSLHSRSLPWDHAAGTVIVTEAGGSARFLDGSAYSVRVHNGSLLSAVNEQAWQTVRDVVEQL